MNCQVVSVDSQYFITFCLRWYRILGMGLADARNLISLPNIPGTTKYPKSHINKYMHLDCLCAMYLSFRDRGNIIILNHSGWTWVWIGISKLHYCHYSKHPITYVLVLIQKYAIVNLFPHMCMSTDIHLYILFRTNHLFKTT